MKQVGILTSYLSFNSNYGAALQACALCKSIEKINWQPFIIPYLDSSEQKYLLPKSKPHRIRERMLYVFDAKKSFAGKWRQYKNRQNREIMTACFKDFKKNIPIYREDQLLGLEELYKIQSEFDAFICGSDQVWNPLIHGMKNDTGYFLRFVQKSKKRIAYAPSFGISKLPNEVEIDLKSAVAGFSALSVREATGARLLKEHASIEVPVVLDPTMLLTASEWLAVSAEAKDLPKHYILCYKFGKLPETLEQIKRVSMETGWPVIELPLDFQAYADGIALKFDVGPAQFIDMVRKADLVMTDSFHATVFSILFHRPFYTFLRQKSMDGKNMNSRMTGLLDLLGLSKRMVMPGEQIGMSELLDIDFNVAECVLEKERAFSFAFLQNALNNRVE